MSSSAKRIPQQVVDTNVILRYLVGDNKKQQQQAQEWFKQAQVGQKRLVIKPLVVAEVCFVLESFYKKSRQDITDALVVLLSQKWLLVDDRQVLLSLWDNYRQGLHFVDSYLLAWADVNQSEVLSFDQEVAGKSKL